MIQFPKFLNVFVASEGSRKKFCHDFKCEELIDKCLVVEKIGISRARVEPEKPHNGQQNRGHDKASAKDEFIVHAYIAV